MYFSSGSASRGGCEPLPAAREMAWKASPAGGPNSRSTVSPSASSPTAPPPTEQQQQEEAASLAISDRRTLYLVNIFIGNTVRFLNSFAAICEEKLVDLRRRIVRVDSSLKLLEAKLSGTSTNGGKEPDQDQQRGCSSSSS